MYLFLWKTSIYYSDVRAFEGSNFGPLRRQQPMTGVFVGGQAVKQQVVMKDSAEG